MNLWYGLIKNIPLFKQVISSQCHSHVNMELYTECCQPSQLHVVLAILLVPLPVLNSTLPSPQPSFWFLCQAQLLPAICNTFIVMPDASHLRSCCDFFCQSCPTSSLSVEHCGICYQNNRQGTCCYWCLWNDTALHKGVSSLCTPDQALKTELKEQVPRNPFLGQLVPFPTGYCLVQGRMGSEAVKHVWKEKTPSAQREILHQDLAHVAHIALFAFPSYFQ